MSRFRLNSRTHGRSVTVSEVAGTDPSNVTVEFDSSRGFDSVVDALQIAKESVAANKLPQSHEASLPSGLDEYIPLDSAVYDVESFGITPFDGPIDPQLWVDMLTSTAASENGPGSPRQFYFKYEATYEFTNRIPWESDDGTLQSGAEIIGASRDGTIIRLMAGAEGYRDPYDAPRSFIRIDSQFNASSPKNNAFWCSVRQCTIEIGKGNPAAIAIEFNTNNIGHIRNVRIRSEDGGGITGIGYGYRSYPNGPSIVKNVIIEGFDYSVSTSANTGEINGAVTLEDVDSVYPNVAGLSLFKVFSMAIRGFRFIGKVPAVLSRSEHSQLVLIDSDLRLDPGADRRCGAIYLRGPGTQFSSLALIRNVTTSGFDAPIHTNAGYIGAPSRGLAAADYREGTLVPFDDDYIDEFVHPTPPVATTGAGGTLNLTLQETPEIVIDDASKWVSVESFGAVAYDVEADSMNPANSSRAAIQAAIDSGAEVVYTQARRDYYGVDGPIYLRGNLKRFVSIGHAHIQRSTGYTGPVIIADDGSEAVVEMYGWWLFNMDSISVQIDTSRSVLMRYMHIHNAGYIDVDGGATLFLEDVHMLQKSVASPDAQQLHIHSGCKVFARHFNPESNHGTLRHIRNDGGELFILGLKTETACGILENLNGAKSEILGGYHLMIALPPATYAWINNNSQLCFSSVTATYDGNHPQNPVLQEVIGAVPVDYNKEEIRVTRAGGMGVVLYVGQKPPVIEPPAPVPDPPDTGTVGPNTPTERVSAAHDARVVQILADISAMSDDPDIILLGHSFVERWFEFDNDTRGGASLSIAHELLYDAVPNSGGRRGNILNVGSNGHQCRWSLFDMLPAAMSGEGLFDSLTVNANRIGIIDLGTNDMWVAGETPADTALGIAACIYFMMTYGKCPKVILHNVLPRTDFVSSEAESCNAAVLAHPWIAYQIGQGNVYYANSDFETFNPPGPPLLSDGLHPTEEGYIEHCKAAEVGLNALLGESDASPAGLAASVASSTINGAAASTVATAAPVATTASHQGITLIGISRGSHTGITLSMDWGGDLGAPIRVIHGDTLLKHSIWHVDDPGVASNVATFAAAGGSLSHMQICVVVTNNVSGTGHVMKQSRDSDTFRGGVNPINSGSLVLEVASNAGTGIPAITGSQTSLESVSTSTTHSRVAVAGPLPDADLYVDDWSTSDLASHTQVLTYVELLKRAS